jgi:hypothetical protein
MYISKWRGNLVGGSDDALALVDYFESRGRERFTKCYDTISDSWRGGHDFYRECQLGNKPFKIRYPMGEFSVVNPAQFIH